MLTKLYARLFTMEKIKYLPPKYSYAMKDLAEFLGIFEITEDQIKQRRSDGGMSDTSSNLSYVTQSAFLPKKSQLDVIREQMMHKEEEDDEEEGSGQAIGQRAKKGSNNLIKEGGGKGNVVGLFNQAATYKGGGGFGPQEPPDTTTNPLQDYARSGVPPSYNTTSSQR